MKVNDIIMELELPHYNKPNYKALGSKPHEIKPVKKISNNPRDYDFTPRDSGIEGQLYSQVDKKLKPIASKLEVLKRHAKDKSLFQQILDKEMYIQKAINA